MSLEHGFAEKKMIDEVYNGMSVLHLSKEK